MLRDQSEGERNEERKTRRKLLKNEKEEKARDRAISLFANFLHEKNRKREREKTS